MGQGQELLYTTHILLAMIICTKYEKDPSNGREVTARTWFRLKTGGRTKHMKTVYSLNLIGSGIWGRDLAWKMVWIWSQKIAEFDLLPARTEAHYGDVKRPSRHPKLLVSLVFVQQFFSDQQQRNIKGPRYCPFVGWTMDSHTKGQ